MENKAWYNLNLINLHWLPRLFSYNLPKIYRVLRIISSIPGNSRPTHTTQQNTTALLYPSVLPLSHAWLVSLCVPPLTTLNCGSKTWAHFHMFSFKGLHCNFPLILFITAAKMIQFCGKKMQVHIIEVFNWIEIAVLARITDYNRSCQRRSFG